MLQAIEQFLTSAYDQFLDDLAVMVNVDCGTANKAGVDAIGAIMRERLSAIGCMIEVFSQQRHGDHVVARLRGTGQGRVLLLAHMDTVFPPGTPQQRPFAVRNGVALGPGVHDMKAGLLAGYYALRALVEIGFDRFEELILLLNSDEEVGSPTSRQLIESVAANADAALVLEGARNGGKIVSARKGVGEYEIDVTGRAAHAGVEPEAGRSAILELAHKIIDVHRLARPEIGTTINVGVIGGGQAVNIVPAEARALVDIRILEISEVQRLEAAFEAIASMPVIPETVTIIRGGVNRPPFSKGGGTEKLLELARAVAHELGFPLEDLTTGGGSDGNFTAGLGVPTLDGLGPDGGGAHSEREFVNLDSIVPRTALVAGLIQAILEPQHLAALRKR